MIPARTIERKRDGATLGGEELGGFLRAYLEGSVSDAQMAAFLMAVTLRGLDSDELDVLVDEMIGSGSVMRRTPRSGGPQRPRVDKHSTGGVGDKISLVLAPLAAALGLDVPMMSGRGLGHTGGTLDKLESIPGFSTALGLADFERVVGAVGTAMIGQTDEIAPLDRRLYALRSATGTVPCIPLIASSIMSKKLSEDLDGLVLDVKVGKGSFLVDRERVTRLAETMVDIGRSRGVPTVALLTRMDWPLGRTIGNALEVVEAVACLRGEGPADLIELAVALTAEMLVLSGVEGDRHTAEERCRAALLDGSALDRFARLIEAQGGDARVVEDPSLLPRAPVRMSATSPVSGTVHAVDPVPLGWGVVELGGGRRHATDSIDPSVGFELAVAPGDSVDEGEVVGWVHAADATAAARGVDVLSEAVQVGQTVPELGPLLVDRLGP